MKKNNKITLVVMLLAAAGFLLQSCGKDSKEPYPPSKITGRVTYNGQPVSLATSNLQLNSGANNNNPLMTFYIRQTAPQPLSGGDQSIFASSDGRISYAAFDGDYTILAVPFKSPWKNIDPISFTLKGTHNVDIPVTPYFWVSNYQTTFVDSVFTATFRLDRIVPNYVNASGATVVPGLEYVRAYFNVTSHADAGAAIFTRSFSTTTGITINGNCTISVNLKAMTINEKQQLRATTGKLWVNVGVKTTDITDPLYQVPVALK